MAGFVFYYSEVARIITVKAKTITKDVRIRSLIHFPNEMKWNQGIYYKIRPHI